MIYWTEIVVTFDSYHLNVHSITSTITAAAPNPQMIAKPKLAIFTKGIVSTSDGNVM